MAGPVVGEALRSSARSAAAAVPVATPWLAPRRAARRQRRGSRRPAAAATGSGASSSGGDSGSLNFRASVSLNVAASEFAKGLEAGMDADELVAQQLGAETPGQLSDVQGQYREAIKQKLAERAEELRREKEAKAAKFSAGKLAYERGQYPASARLLEQALNEEGPFTQLGGEIQLWLALAYQACGREEDCLATYRTLEKTHPLPAIRRQAADLRYIMEAPKLQISPDERVQIPVLTDLDVNRGNRAPVARPRPPVKRKVEKTWDEEFWENYTGPRIMTNKYVWAAAAVVATLAAVYSSYVQRGLISP